jgi:uncharacterized protein (TIGR02597 family)
MPNPKSYLVMKPIISFALLGALFAVGAANAAVTDPVGYVSLGDTTVGQPAIKANTDVHVSIPLLRSAEFAGVVASTGANTITITGATFTANQWNAGTPYVVVVESGTKSGMILPILSNTTNELTVDLGSFSLAGVAAADQVSIRKAWTVSSFMAGASSLNGVILFAFSNSSTGINVSSDIQYFYNGSGWEDGDGNPSDNAILYPGEGFIVRNGATPVTSFTLTGDVPVAKHFVQVGTNVGGPRDSFLSYIGPVTEELGDSGAGFAAGDILFTFDNTAAGQNKSGTPYFYTGAGWEDGDGNPADTFGLVGGTSFLYRRATAPATGLIDWQDEQSYVPTL